MLTWIKFVLKTPQETSRQLHQQERYHEAYWQALREFRKTRCVLDLSYAGVQAAKYLGWHRRAESCYRRALKIDSENASIWYNRSCNEARRRRFLQSVKYLVEAIDRDQEKYFSRASDDEVFVESNVVEKAIEISRSYGTVEEESSQGSVSS